MQFLSDDLENNNTIVNGARNLGEIPLDKAIWFLPAFDHVYRGGIRTILEVMAYLSREYGTHHTIVLYGEMKVSLDEIEHRIHGVFSGIKFDLINITNKDEVYNLPGADVSFCTLWTTAYLMLKYNKCKVKYYFIQDFEPKFYAGGSMYGLIEQTYRFGYFAICNTAGVAEACKPYTQQIKYFTPAVDHEIYYPLKTVKNRKPYRIVFYGRPKNSRNGFNLCLKSLAKVKRHYGDDVEIISVGAEYNASSFGVKGIINNLGILPTLEDVAELYRSSDIGLVFMFSTHPSYQPLEYMACGCVTVTNENYYNKWLYKDRENVILTAPTVNSVANSIIATLEDHELREHIIKGGINTVKQLSWEKTYQEIGDIIKHPFS